MGHCWSGEVQDHHHCLLQGGYGKGGQRSRRHWGAMVKGVRGLGDTGGYGKGGQGSRRHRGVW